MQQINDLLDAKLIEKHRSQEKRNYLGASMLGDECIRKIQLQYMRHEMDFSAQNLRTFAIGHCLEDLIAEWIRLAGFDLRTRNENNEQFSFSIANGKIARHVDGIIFSGPDFLKYPLLWECKTMSNKSWNDTQKRGVLVTKPMYYAQVQLYMAYLDLEANPCMFTALNKDTSELYHELIAFDAEAAQRYSDRAVQIIKATENNELLPCVSSDSSFFRCKMCGFRNECFKK
ncbi:MAG: YqaJ viral recombinase family protein [Holosporaceae bacterium]|jgi:hypothetical protein|nr:YqaJ viral recombinase family protein [Holosporaceae bacterium]